MIIIIGPSASGKTEIAKKLIKNFNFEKFITTTTRPIRINEKNNEDYYFVTNEDFLDKINNNEFIEYTLYNSNYYGSYKKEINDNKVIILEPNGLDAFNKLNLKNTISFYIDTDKHIREKRMKDRGDKKEDIEKRLKNDDKIFLNAKDKVNYKISNNEKSSLDEPTNLIYKIYKENIN